MRYAILADIHGNREALEAVIEACRSQGVRQYFCAGDMIGYGADPSACLTILRKLKAVCIAGNHEWAVTGKLDESNLNEVVLKALRWTRNYVSEQEFIFLQSLNLIYSHDHFQMAHGALNRPEQFMYIKDTQQTVDTYYLMKRPLCFIGHTHIPQVFMKKGKVIEIFSGHRFELCDGYDYIVNPGSVGQPRDGNPQAAFCIYDPDLKRIDLKRVNYDVEKAQKRIFQAGLPDILAWRLAIGQ